MSRKRVVKFSALATSEQVDALQRAADLLEIPEDDRYLHHYPLLIRAIDDLQPLNATKLSLAASAIFSWMPTQMVLEHRRLIEAHDIIDQLEDKPLTKKSLAFLAHTFKTIRGKSVVAVSKLLHFINPEKFSIIDSIVAAKFGVAPNGDRAEEDYLFYLGVLQNLRRQNEIVSVCEMIRAKMALKHYCYPVSDLRALELLLFLTCSEMLLPQKEAIL